MVASSEDKNFSYIPKDITFNPDASYVHITSNNTIFGTQWQEYPDCGDVPLIADVSSDIISRKIDVGKFGIMYAGAQKNMGPSGVTTVIIREDLIEKASNDIPTMLKYKTHTEKSSLFNTPPSFSIYMCKLVLEWVKENGGIAGAEERNRQKAEAIYKVIDESNGYFTGHAELDSRSMMNITFRLPSDELGAKCIEEAKASGLSGLKGHRSVGGMRASIYNAMPVEGAKKLAEFLKEFQQNNQYVGKKMKIFISDPFSKDLPDKLRDFGEVTDNKDEYTDADIILVRSATKARKDYIDSAKNLKMIIRGGVGIDNIDVSYARSKGIKVHNTPEASSVAVAELAFAMMLAIQRNIVRAHNSTKSGEWIKKQLKGQELYKKTLGLIGIGLIGTEVAKRANAFGMNVIAHRLTDKPSDYAKIVSLDELLAQSDIISLHAPITEETEGMINKETISKMKDGVVLINTARGKLIVDEDLVEALNSSKIRYAGLDVYHSEPL